MALQDCANITTNDEYKSSAINITPNDKNHRERNLTERLLDDAIDAAFDEFQTAQNLDEAACSREALESCLQRVSERGQNVLKARFIDELSYEQIGHRIGMTLEAVRKMLFRVKKQVRACVETSLKEAL